MFLLTSTLPFEVISLLSGRGVRHTFEAGAHFLDVLPSSRSCRNNRWQIDMNESQSVATNSHLPTAAYSPGSWWPPHRFCSLPLHILYFSSYSGLIEGSQIRTDLKQPPRYPHIQYRFTFTSTGRMHFQ